MAIEKITIDPRIASPLVCRPEDPLSRFPRDTLDRVAGALGLFAELLGNYNGESELMANDDHRHALSLQLDSMAAILRAQADDFPRSPTTGSNEIIVEFSQDEFEKLTVLAARKCSSVHDVVVEIVTDKLRAFIPDRKPL